MSFYDEWLGYWDEAEEERRTGRRSTHEEDLVWEETPQDAKAALLIAPEIGYRTWGSVTALAEIPPGHSTGAVKRGEEAVFFLDGEGFSIIDGIRYDWRKYSALAIPFGTSRQHFNTSDVPVRYVSALAVHLERLVGIHRTQQLSTHGPISGIPEVETSESGLGPDGFRVRLHFEDAYEPDVSDESAKAHLESAPKYDADNPLVVGDVYGMMAMPMGLHKAKIVRYMRIGQDVNDFDVHSVEITGLLTDPPQEYGGKHAHMEAHLYVLGGTGYTTVGDEKVHWKPGTALQIPGPQTPHQHVNTGEVPSEMLRIGFGIRYFFERVAKREYPYLFISPRQGFDQPASV